MKSPLYNVLHRELCRMTSRRLYLGVCLVLPLFCLFFMATIFGSGQMENIPIGIVDQDNTATSRQIARNIPTKPPPGKPCNAKKYMVTCLFLPALNSMLRQEWMPRFLTTTIMLSSP